MYNDYRNFMCSVEQDGLPTGGPEPMLVYHTGCAGESFEVLAARTVVEHARMDMEMGMKPKVTHYLKLTNQEKGGMDDR